MKLIENMDYPKLGDYLNAKFPDRVVANVGQKGYQVESMAASSSDIWVRMGSAKVHQRSADRHRAVDGQVPRTVGQRARLHLERPPLLHQRRQRRLTTYGTKITAPAWIYPEDGRYAPRPSTPATRAATPGSPTPP